MTARIAPAPRPYEKDMEETLEKLMPPGVEPLSLFRTLACNPRVFRRFMAGGLLDKGSLTLRDREIVIDRATGLCNAEYEWGVHMALFGERVGFGEAEAKALVAPDGAEAACWSPHDRLLIRMVDELHETATVGDALWADLAEEFEPGQLIELLVLTGFYHMVSFTVNALNLAPEAYAKRFP